MSSTFHLGASAVGVVAAMRIDMQAEEAKKRLEQAVQAGNRYQIVRESGLYEAYQHAATIVRRTLTEAVGE